MALLPNDWRKIAMSLIEDPRATDSSFGREWCQSDITPKAPLEYVGACKCKLARIPICKGGAPLSCGGFPDNARDRSRWSLVRFVQTHARPHACHVPLGTSGVLGSTRNEGSKHAFEASLEKWADASACDCAQFCAHHQTLPSVTDCQVIGAKACWTRHLWHVVAIHRTPCKLLILRARRT